MEHMEKQAETKKINTGKIGFILSLVILPALCLSFSSSLTLLLILISPILCLLLFISLIFSVHGLIKNRNRKLAITGILVNIFSIILLFFLFITFTPPGSMPYPLNIYKFKRSCPQATFWLDFDKEHVAEVQSLYTVIIAKYAAVSFHTNNSYNTENIIEYAEKNGWKHHCSFPLFEKDFQKFDSKTLDSDNEEEDLLMEVICYCIYQSLIILKEDCNVLVFDTDDPLGYPSYAFISKNNSEFIIFYQNPVLPDSHTDYFFTICEDLSKVRSKQEEQIYEN